MCIRDRISDVPVRRNAQQLEDEHQQETDDFYDQEANDIRGFAGDDEDGQFYDEDRDDEFAE